MTIKKQKKKLKKIKFAIFISDVGYGHMVRQRCIIRQIEKEFKNFEILIINDSNIEIIKQTFKEKYKYLKKFNNIKIYTNKRGFYDLKKTNKLFSRWKSEKNNIFDLEEKIRDYDVIISDFVPEAFELAKKLKIKCYGVCHFTWSWFFSASNYKNKRDIEYIKKIENLADKIFFPPFTPKKIFSHVSKKISKNVNFITEVEKENILKNKKPVFLIMDNGKGTLRQYISKTLKYMAKNKEITFYIAVDSLSLEDKRVIIKSDNLIPVIGLKNIYSEIIKVDYVIARAGFNTISECLIYKKPTMFF